MSHRTINTRLFFLYLLTLLLYWTNLVPILTKNPVFFIVSSAVLIILTFVYYSQAFSSKRITRSEQLLVFIFSTLLFAHIMFSQTNILQGVNILLSFYIYLILPKVPLNSRLIYKVIFWSFIIMTILFLPSVIWGLTNTSSDRASFSGFFNSSNSMGDLGLSALLCFFLLRESEIRKSKKKLYVFMSFVLLVIISSHQRSAIVMLIAWFIAFFVLKRGWDKKIVFIGFVVALALVGYYMLKSELFTPYNTMEEYELFGKEATSRGRSEQIFLALSYFDITPLGEGRGIVNAFVKEDLSYTVHNTFVVSLLEYGYLIFAFYFIFWFWIYRKGNNLAASFILAYHVILFFEPENFFSNQLLPFIAFSIVLISEGNSFKENEYEFIKNRNRMLY